MAFDPGMFNHFNERLQERYGLSCTVEEWRKLGQSPLEIIYHHKKTTNGRHTMEGLIRFKGKRIHIVIELGVRYPVTALPLPKFEKYKKSKKKVEFKLIR